MAKEKGVGIAAEDASNLEFEKTCRIAKKVDFILNKIKAMLAQYSEDIKPENKK